ncbi:MAG TPA: ATP-binding protein, partial [Anaerolineae bacterium]|nr:ATP-binding protein [Anaerolineae bacterium]
RLQLSGAIRAITALNIRATTTRPQSNNLILVTEAGFVRLFQFKPNYPPLLTAPTARNIGNQYEIVVNIFDVENSEIVVSLDLYDNATEQWVTQELQQRTRSQVEQLRWQVTPLTNNAPLRYRFRYIDSENNRGGLLQPPAGPITQSSFANGWLALLPLVALLAFLAGLTRWATIRQRPANRAWRFFRQIERAPSVTLTHLRARYNQLNGEPGFFFNLANYARQADNNLIAGLADGLYLLADRPTVGIDILNSILEEISAEKYGTMLRTDEWATMLGTTQRLLETPTLTELSLLREPLNEMLITNERTGGEIGPFPRLAPIFDALRASERVDTVEDRLAYLGDADTLLRQLEQTVAADKVHLSNALVGAIVQRWRGLVRAADESLRGRARLDIRLKTKRVAPKDSAEIAFELVNAGLSSAEQINLTVYSEDTPHHTLYSRLIPTLAPTHKRTISFKLPIPDQATFRIACQINYTDRLSNTHQFEYADMINVLAPAVDFRPIPNPYSPGTPLRRNSALFFGRHHLFNFIASEAERASQQHVLILVGQRRTGKTSALLRLNQHLPSHLIPIYIDCQSLGVLPGMVAFFQDLSWQIADTLAERHIEIDVPDLSETGQNPAKWFQHQFIPQTRTLLPEHTKLVLVFDEFEALENLVTDGILPRTIFSFLRHLMQHGEGLSFIFVGTHRLEEMTTDYWSVLFNIALYQEISYLTDSAAINLITEPVAPQLVYDDLALDKILRVTANHPYFLQLVCYSLVKRANTT